LGEVFAASSERLLYIPGDPPLSRISGPPLKFLPSSTLLPAGKARQHVKNLGYPQAMNSGSALEIASATDPGTVRARNEDCLAADSELGLAVLADGMGGYSAGEVASGIAVAVLASEMKRALADENWRRNAVNGPTELLREHIARANATILRAAKKQPQYSGMGTTLVAAMFHDNRVCVGHVGDSRMYRLRNETFTQLTRDHSLLQEQIDSGFLTKEEARLSQNKNLVTRALGVDERVESEIRSYDVQPGDLYLLCSDGLNDMVLDEEIQLVLNSLNANLPLAASQLVQMANDNGGLDNVSVILVKVLSEFPASRGLLEKFLSWFRK
jgi:serine/threonine protein phosphatase PrpC